jgi:hypothetical protein
MIFYQRAVKAIDEYELPEFSKFRAGANLSTANGGTHVKLTWNNKTVLMMSREKFMEISDHVVRRLGGSDHVVRRLGGATNRRRYFALFHYMLDNKMNPFDSSPAVN